MSHITCQAERDENEAIFSCEYRSVQVWVERECLWTGELIGEWSTENQCGQADRVSVAKDRCRRCGKTFTY